MKLRFLYAAMALLLAATPAMSENFLDIEGGDATSVGIYVKDLTTGSVVVDYNSRLALTPASVTKAVTTATALQTLGADWRFTTTVELSGERSVSSRSCWNGNLVISASGDPTLESSEFKSNLGFTDSIISSLKRLGISEIDGTVIIREHMTGAGPVPQWEIEDLAWEYGAGLYDFNYAGNVVRAYPNTGKTIPASDLKIKVLPSDDGDTDMQRGINSENLIVWGSAKNRQNKKWNLGTTIPDPANVYIKLLTSRLKTAGIKISTKRSIDTGSTPVYTHRSPKLGTICRNLMKRSDNLFAEGVLRAIKRGETRKECIKAEKAYWTDKGINAKNTIINDGSGLTRANRISPRFIGDMLEWMAKSDNAKTYVDFFPVSGVDGTLKSLLAKTRLKGHLAMKTGSVSAVQCYAGYKLDPDGNPTHVVVIMVNGFFCSRASLRKQIENFLLKTFVD